MTDDHLLKISEYDSKIQDYEVKLQNYEKSVEEIQKQLELTTIERNKLLETTNQYELEISKLQQEKASIRQECNSLYQDNERLTNDHSRLQQEIFSYQEQLKNAINEKCKVIARIDEIESKGMAIDMKERRWEQEHNLLNCQLQALTEDLDRSNNDLQAIRRDHTIQQMQLATNLTERTDQLKILQAQHAQFKETNAEFSEKITELSGKLFKQNEESARMMEFYKKELDAQARMIDLYKNNAHDIELERTEFTNAIAELKRMLSEASDEYGKLETKHAATIAKHEEELQEKENQITNLRTELEHANELINELRSENVETAILKISPSAATACRLIRTDISLTELYSMYAKISEELVHQKRENARLNHQMKCILDELEENAPNIKKQELEYTKLLEEKKILLVQIDELINEKEQISSYLANKDSAILHMEKENKKLRTIHKDVSRQVCLLVREVDRLRNGFEEMDSNRSSEDNINSTDELVSKKLVTFKSVSELHDNNVKLLAVVRELTSKVEETEGDCEKMKEKCDPEKAAVQMKRIEELYSRVKQQKITIEALMSKCERYKVMFFKARGYDIDVINMNTEDIDENSDTMSNNVKTEQLEKRIADLEEKLKESKDQYKTLKEQHEYYFQEKKNNDKIMNEQFDTMRTELRELTSTNCKLATAVEHTKEQMKVQQKNIQTYKQQISALEERNKNYEKAIVKHEQTIHYLKNEIMKEQCHISKASSQLNHLQHENRLLKDSSTRLQLEKETYQREHQSQNLVLNSIELIKTNLERSQSEGKMRLEQQLDETVRELAAQRRRFQEDVDRYREINKDLERQTVAAKQEAEEQRIQSEKLRNDLISLREELSNKSKQLDELNKRIQETLQPNKNDNPITLANKRAREFEIQVESLKIERESLVTELSKLKEHADQYYRMSQSAESEIKNIHEMHTTYVKKTEEELKELRLSEENLKSKILELESNIELKNISEKSDVTDSDELKKLQNDQRDVLQKLSECSREVLKLRNENKELNDMLQLAESKYANEMMMHSSDIQYLTNLKSEHNQVNF